MAVTTVQDNNKLTRYQQEICREWIKENMFSPYMGEASTSIIRRVLADGKSAGDQVNIPIVTRLQGAGVGTGTLTGNEEAIDNYGMRMGLGWARHGVKTNKDQKMRSSADLFGAAKPMLSEWLTELQRDEIIAALMALPSETVPTDGNTRVNGIQYDLATAAERNTWNSNNSDRVLYGTTTANYNATHSTALANCDTTSDKLTAANLSTLKRVADSANPRIRPFKTKNGYQYFVCFAGTNTFYDLKSSLETINKDARPREDNGVNSNPIFQDGDQIYDGIIVRKVPEISDFVTNVWTTLKTAGAASARVEPVFLCGQQALAMPIGQMPTPTEGEITDYGFVKSVGIEAAYGIGKMFKKPQTGTALVQWGVATGFFATA